MLRRALPTLTIVLGFAIGLLLASLDHILPPFSIQSGPGQWIIFFVDWIAPPLAGTLLAGALIVAQRNKRLHAAEKAAAEVLAERLAGTERRQALWVVAAAVAHDLKNPLHNLQLLVEEIGEEQDPARRTELLSRIGENVARATERLGELTRAGQGPSDESVAVDLSATLDELRQRLAPTAQASGTALEIQCPRGLSVRGDAHALRSAVENVAANALEALQARGRGGKLALRAARRDEETIELLVEDDGPGIAPALRARLFTPFSSGHAGTGLGLAIARALARAGGGDLTCTDAGPGRTSFRFVFRPA